MGGEGARPSPRRLPTVQPPSIVIIGAGATGRGQIGQLAHSAGWAITFIERRKDLIERLRAARRYVVRLAGEETRDIEVSGFDVLDVAEAEACAEAIARADVVATAVLPTNLESTVPTLAAGLALRARNNVSKPLNIIACENMERSSTTLRRYLDQAFPARGLGVGPNSDSDSAVGLDWAFIEAHAGFPDAMVARAIPVPEPDPLVLLAEADQEWSVDATRIKEPMPRLEGMTLSPNQDAALERKLYIKNTGHVAFGVLGYLEGYRLMDEAARDPEIFARVDAATRESAAAVAAKHGFPPEHTEQYRRSFLEQMKSPLLPDEIKRVIREPIRKLGREERLIGPAMLACEQGQAPRALAYVIAAMLRVVNPDDPQSVELQSRLAARGPEAVLREIGGIPEGHALLELVSRRVSSFANGFVS